MSVRLDQLKASMRLDEKAFERSEFEAGEWQKILLRWPQIRDCEANFHLCQDACHPLDLTLDSITLLLENDETFAGQLVLASAETNKQDLINKICEYLEEMTDAPGVVENRRKLMAFWSLENLRKELLRVESVQNLRDEPVGKLREIARAGRSAAGPPELPNKIMIHGEMVKLDAARIKSLDRESLKTLIRKFGADEVNRRLRGE
jgi:hypothetical protein